MARGVVARTVGIKISDGTRAEGECEAKITLSVARLFTVRQKRNNGVFIEDLRILDPCSVDQKGVIRGP
jgi:hypothetical protein